MEDKRFYISTKIIQPSANIKDPTTVITPIKLEILDYISIPPDSLKNNGLKSTSIFTFSKRMFMEKYSSKNSYNIFFHRKEKVEKTSNCLVQQYEEDNNFNQIQQDYSVNSQSEQNSSLLGDLDDHENKKTLKEKNEIIDKDHTIKTESGIEDEKDKIIQDQTENKTQQSHETNICTEKGIIEESNKEYEYERYFRVLEILDFEAQKEQIDEEKEFFSNIIRLFSSEKDKEINIMEINLEFFLKDFNTNHYFEGKYYIKSLNNEFYISFPDWFCKKENFTLKDIIVSLFEMNVILTWYFKVESFPIDIGEISEIYKENYLTILLFENLCDQIDNIIEKVILSKEKITEFVEEIRKDTAKLEQENKIKNELLEINNFERKDKCPEEIRNELKEEIFEKLSKAKNGNKIKALLDMLFLNFYSFMNGERFIRSKIRKYIIDYFKPFLKYISKQIAIYSKKTVDNQEKIKSYFTNIYNLIQERLEILKSEYKIKITKYGSYASKLFIEGSDMDLLIYYKENKESKVSTFGEKLYKLFKNYKNIFLINKIDEKNLITLNFFFQDIIFEDPYNYINNKKNYPPINQTISVDITYTSKRDEYYKKKKIVEKILDKLLENPHIFFCYFVLKRILVINNLNKIYYGGLSSYGIQSLVFHIEDRTLKISPNKTKSGEFLFIFFVRYSKFDFYKYVVEKDGNKRRKKSEHPKTLKNPEYYENMITIDDPMDEDNLIKGGYTPTKFFIDKPKNYICEKIRTLFQKEFEVLKNCYLEFSKKTKKEKTTEKKMDFILELFNVKIDNK